MRNKILWQDKPWESSWILAGKIADVVIYLFVIILVALFFVSYLIGIYAWAFLVIALFLVAMKFFFDWLGKKMKEPLKVTQEGFSYSKSLSHRDFARKSEIKTILFGDGKEVSKFTNLIGKYGIFFSATALRFGQFGFASGAMLATELAERKLLKIETEKEVLTFFLNDSEGFVEVCKKIGINFEKRNNISYYEKQKP